MLFHPDTPAELLPTSSLDMTGCPVCKVRDGCWPNSLQHAVLIVHIADMAGCPVCKGGPCCREECNTCWEDIYGWFAEENLASMRAAVAAHFADRVPPPEEEPEEESDEAAAAGQRPGPWWYCEFVQSPGEIVFVPSLWHHAVMNLDDTVRVDTVCLCPCT
eukprot:SAG22_NODE_298_length_12785_cov_5.760129_3_plen_161_part_00